MEKIFISDIHLASERPKTLAMFLRYIQERPQQGDALYLLGDIFDVWVGDDDDAPLAVRVKAALAAVTRRGINLYLQRGNRDFLMGQQLLDETGAILLDDPMLTDVAGEKTLLMHGDLLCTDDIAYQKARIELRNPATQKAMMSQSLDARRELAAEYRQRSGEVISMTAADIMDANEKTVRRYLEHYGASQMIHGHTHRPAVHHHQLSNGKQATRYVLDEWHQDTAAAWVDDGISLKYEEIKA